MASLKKKKQLIDKIVHGNKKYKFSIGRYGGETVMGVITREQYEYWKERDDELMQYLMGFDRQEYENEHEVPEEARFDRDWYEQDSVEHACGGEVSEGQLLYIEELDQDGNPIKEWEPIDLGPESRHKHGIKLNEHQEYDADHESVMDKCYFYGQAFNKGSWYSEAVELPGELDLSKITLNCSNVEGWRVCQSIGYDGLEQTIDLQEDSTGKSQTCCVREGWQNPKKKSKKKEPQLSDFIAPEYLKEIQKAKSNKKKVKKVTKKKK